MWQGRCVAGEVCGRGGVDGCGRGEVDGCGRGGVDGVAGEV